MGKEEYREMFSRLHTSIDEEAIIMNEKRQGKPRMAALVLAAVLVLALAVGAAAVWQHQLQDLLLPGRESAASEPAETPQSQSYDPFTGDTDIISLQGYADSPEYRAALAWAEFQHDYDRDGEALKAVGNDSTQWDEKYGFNGYPVYTQEMADKIEEIAEKYSLTLHSGGLQSATVQELEARFGDFLSTDRYGGYYYEDGTLQCDAEQNSIGFQLRRCMKGTLDTVLLGVADVEVYMQWEYAAACGETVLLALGPSTALIIADLESSFVTVNVSAGSQSTAPLTREELQAIADSIDFSIL